MYSQQAADNHSQRSLEQRISALWAELFHKENIGVNDNFFDLGGTSLLATQVLSRIRNDFQRDIPFANFFTQPTVAELAACVLASPVQEASYSPLSIPTVPRDQPIPLSFSQEQVWFLQQLDATNQAYQFHATIQFNGQLNVAGLEWSLSEMVRRHEIFRTTFVENDGQPYQIVQNGQSILLPVVDLSKLSETEQEAQCANLPEAAFHKPFDMQRLPLVRWLLIRTDRHRHTLVHVEHHLLHDGWSFNVFLEELFTLYQAYINHEPPALAEVKIHFADFAAWQRQWMHSEQARQQLTYWKHQLARIPPALKLPFDYPRPPVQSFRGQVSRFDLPEKLSNELREFSQQHQTTLFSTMMTAFVVLLYRYARQKNICLGTGMANRRTPIPESLLGMLINTVALYFNLPDCPTFTQILKQCQQLLFAAQNNQECPFDQVVTSLRLPRDLSRSPVYQVAFSFHDAPLIPVHLPDVDVTITSGLSNGSAKFDLNVIAIPYQEQLRGLSEKNRDEKITMIWEYCVDLFQHQTIEQMIRDYLIILDTLLIQSDSNVETIPLMVESATVHPLIEHLESPAPTGDFQPGVQPVPRIDTPDREVGEKTYRATDLSDGKHGDTLGYLASLSAEEMDLLLACLEP